MNQDIVVMKFGGTSVASEAGRSAIARRVKAHADEGKSCVLVVSAMGRKGDPYATDTLLGLVETLPADKKELDALQAVGEIISSVVVAHELRERGIDAEAFSAASAGIFASGEHLSGKISEIHTSLIFKALEAGKVAVVAGFQALNEQGEFITLGRGGSDTSACALGVALSAKAVEIYSDVDGILSADPRAVTEAMPLEVIAADELFQLASMGSRIIHAPAAELALNAQVPLILRNTYSDFEGTRVVDIAAYRALTIATAITVNSDIVRFCVSLRSEEGCLSHMSAQTKIYEMLALRGISLDMFTPAGAHLYFTVAQSSFEHCKSALEEEGFEFSYDLGLSKVTLIGNGMHGVPGVMARIALALAPAGIDIYQTADSHNTISVVVKSEQANRAQEILHEAFELGDEGISRAEALGSTSQLSETASLEG